MIEFTQKTDTCFIVGGLYPRLELDVIDWFKEFNIEYETIINEYGQAGFQYDMFLYFKTEEDAMAFKLVWL